MNRILKIAGLALCVVALAWHLAFAAADYTASTDGQPWQVVTATTSAVINVTLARDDYTITHLGYQNDGTTASVAGDYVVIMRNKDEAGVAVTMAANLTDGIKLPLLAFSSCTFPGRQVPSGTDGPVEIQIKAVTHGAKLLITRGRSPRE